MKKNFISILLCSLFGSLALISCENKDYEEPWNSTGFTGLPIVNENTIQFYWYGNSQAQSYTFQLSTDEEFSEIVFAENLTQTTILITDLEEQTQYFARFQANYSGVGSSEWYYAEPVLTGTVYTPTDPTVLHITDLFSTYTEISIQRMYSPSHIYFSASDSDGNTVGNTTIIPLIEDYDHDGDFIVDLEDSSVGYITFPDGVLTEDTYYKLVSVYDSEDFFRRFDSVIFSTSVSTDLTTSNVLVPKNQPLEPVLRRLMEQGDDIAVTLEEGYNSNVLNPFEFTGLSLTIEGTLDANGNFTSNLLNDADIVIAGVADVVVKNIKINGVWEGVRNTDHTNFISFVGTVQPNSVNIDNCYFLNYPYGIAGSRVNTSGVFPKSFIIENCIIKTDEEVSNAMDWLYAFINLPNLSAEGEASLIIRNNTFIDLYNALLGSNTGMATALTDLLHYQIINNTFFGTDRMASWMVRLDASNTTASWHNNIWAKNPRWTTPEEWRPAIISSLLLNYSNNYRTSDQNDGSSYKLSSVGTLEISATTSQLFPGYAQEDFTINPTVSVQGRRVAEIGVGDSRWFEANVDPAPIN